MIRQIAAIDSKRGIAKKGRIPWHLSKDIARFRQLTLTDGSNMLMGRTTYDLLGYLEGRHYFVVSHRDLELPEYCTLIKDIDKFVTDFKENLWVIGGAEIFAETLKYADELYLTQVDGDFNCDRFFPDYSSFKLKKTEGPYSENNLSFSYQLYMP